MSTQRRDSRNTTSTVSQFNDTRANKVEHAQREISFQGLQTSSCNPHNPKQAFLSETPDKLRLWQLFQPNARETLQNFSHKKLWVVSPIANASLVLCFTTIDFSQASPVSKKHHDRFLLATLSIRILFGLDWSLSALPLPSSQG